MAILISALIAAALLLPAEDKSWIGARACSACHAAQFSAQSSSGHAHTLGPATGHRLAADFEKGVPLRRAPSFAFEMARGASGLSIKVSDGRSRLELPIDWAFGSGTHAVTFVGQVDEDSYVEHYWTYYTAGRSLEATPGHERLAAQNLAEAAGVRYRTFDPETKILRCFRCHSTGPLTLSEKLELRPTELGVRCEACHGAGSEHAAAAGRGDFEAARRAIANPGRLDGAGLNQLCGTCHRKPAPAGTATNWSDPWNVRHQPMYLAESVCFRESRGALSCITCHAPHAALQRNEPGHYNARCATCHARKPHPVLAAGAQPDECVACHMPAVEPRRHLRFTNHWIGVYRAGAALRPSR
jgi:hypothetical protein